VPDTLDNPDFSKAMDCGVKGALYYTCQERMRRKVTNLVAGLNLAPGSRIVDAGCGSGILAVMALGGIVDRPSEMLLIEMVMDSVVKAEAAVRQAVHTERRNEKMFLSLVHGTVPEDIPPTWHGRANLVICAQVAMYIPKEKKPAFITGLAKLVAPGGTLIMPTIHPDFAAKMYKPVDGKPGSVWVGSGKGKDDHEEHYVPGQDYVNMLHAEGLASENHQLPCTPEMAQEPYCKTGDILWDILYSRRSA
jgi:hypothetical protein